MAMGLTTSLMTILMCFLPKCLANSGNEFYIGAMRNNDGITENFLLYITTPSVSPVEYIVETTSGVQASGNVTHNSTAIVSLPVSLVTNDRSYSSRFKGIHVYSSDDGRLLSILVVNKKDYTIGDYFAYPYKKLQLFQYQYYAVSTETLGSDNLSEVLLVGNEDNTTVTVVPTQTVTVPVDIQTNSSSRTVTAGSSFTFTIHRMQTFLIGASASDISGTSIVSNKPLTVISGHECGNIPLRCCCEHITEQIPPTVTWGTKFFVIPYAGQSLGPYVKIIASESQTTVIFSCIANSIPSSNIVQLQFAGDVTVKSLSGSYCYIKSDKPILVVQLGTSGDRQKDYGDPVISMIPPIEQYQQSITFVVPSLSGISRYHVNIATTKKGSVLLDGQSISVTWDDIYDNNDIVIGYGTQIQLNNSLSSDSHTIKMQSKFSALVYGFGTRHGLSYSAGVNLIQLVQNSLQLSPWNGNNLGGVPVRVSGPYFKESDKIELSFDDVVVNCSRTSNVEALCVSPFLATVGKVDVAAYINSFQYERTAVYYSVPFINDDKVSIQNNSLFYNSDDSIDITWLPELLSDEVNSTIDISIYELQETSDGTLIRKEIAVLASDLPNNGEATLTIPELNVRSKRVIGFIAGLVIIGVKVASVGAIVGAVYFSTAVPVLYDPFDLRYSKCLEWASTEPASIGTALLDSVKGSAPCPPNVDQTSPNLSPGLIEDDIEWLIGYFHPQASRCFRQSVASSNGAGNQCCYRSDGSLIVGSPSGGSVDKIAPTGSRREWLSNVYGHFFEDVVPFIYCCRGSKTDCGKYYERRPSDDGSSFVNVTPPACVYGDPHIVTLDLHKYTFNGKGEFILIETNDQFFMLQGRMEVVSNINGSDAPGTVFTAVAAKQEDSDTIQFEIKSNATLICLVNGEMIDFNELKRQEFRNVSVFDAENKTFSASFSSGAYLEVKEMNGFIAVFIVNLPKQYKGLTRGLMGNYNGDISDDLIPKGSNESLPLNSSLQTIHEQFGMTWIINSFENSLFTYSFNETWRTYYNPSFTPVYEPVFTNTTLEEKANEICGNDEFCKFDIAATGRTEVGEATYNGGQDFEQLVNMSKPIICNPPCVHGACVSNDSCACGEGYEGSICNLIVTTPCIQNPCNGGGCQYHAGSYICTCPPELTGEFCEESNTIEGTTTLGLESIFSTTDAMLATSMSNIIMPPSSSSAETSIVIVPTISSIVNIMPPSSSSAEIIPTSMVIVPTISSIASIMSTSSTTFVPPSNTTSTTASIVSVVIGSIVGLIVFLAAVVVIAVLFFVVLQHKRSKNKSDTEYFEEKEMKAMSKNYYHV